MIQNHTTSDLKIGRTTVKVFRRDVNPQTMREVVTMIHEGIVVGTTTLFARIFNPAPISKGGDVSIEMSQKFPFRGKDCWCEVTGEKRDSIRIPAIFAS